MTVRELVALVLESLPEGYRIQRTLYGCMPGEKPQVIAARLLEGCGADEEWCAVIVRLLVRRLIAQARPRAHNNVNRSRP